VKSVKSAKPKALIRSKKLEKKIQNCIFDFEHLKKMYGSRIVIVERSWNYTGREDEPNYVRDNHLINELFLDYPKVFYAYCSIRPQRMAPSRANIFFGGSQSFSVSPQTGFIPSQLRGFSVLNQIVTPAINLHATFPITGLAPRSNPSVPQLKSIESGPVYIGGKTEKEVLSVLDRAERYTIML
jgi:hypothetical protein